MCTTGPLGHGASDFARRARITVRDRVRLTALLLASLQFISSDSAISDYVDGTWTSPQQDDWPLVPVHATLTPDGRVLTFGSNSGGQATGFFIYDVWDPAAGLDAGHVTLPNTTGTDIFCGTSLILPTSSEILIAGGANWTGSEVSKVGNNESTIFNSGDDTLTRGEQMNRARWYASAVPLMDGEVYVQGGLHGEDFPEVRERDGTFRLLTGAPTGRYSAYYPRNFIAPDGRLFGFDTDGQMFFVETDGIGSIADAGQFDIALAGHPSTSVMYRPGQILQISGKNNRAITIDIDGDTPVVRPAGSLSTRRSWANATVLPNGRVLVTGGSGEPNKLVGVNNSAEMWDPETGKWSVLASGLRPRLYHSFALLLPDASVLVGGGGASLESPVNNLHSEIYFPPYLYESSGGLAARPVIESAPDVLEPGQPFQIKTGADGIDRVTLLGAGAVTHGVNLQQRFIELEFSATGDSISAQMPGRAGETPPGYYLLFVLDRAGTPSRAKIVQVSVAGASPPPSPPPAPSPEGGGGATGLEWLVMLGLINAIVQEKRNAARCSLVTTA